MDDIKKEQEREELHRAIWAIADELRGSVDGWDFKSNRARCAWYDVLPLYLGKPDGVYKR